MALSLLSRLLCSRKPRMWGQKVTIFGGKMKKSLFLILTTSALAAFAQAPAPDSSTTTAAPATTTSAVTTTVKPPPGTVVGAPAKPPVKSPWSGAFIADASRATDINHSKILDPDSPDTRTDYSLTLIGQLKYKSSDKNAWTVTEYVAKDFVRNPSAGDANDYKVLNMRFGWTRSTKFTLFGSGAIALPFSVALPTSYASRAAGSIAAFRFKPAITWEIDPTYSVTWVSQTDATFANPVEKDYAYDNIVEQAKLALNNSVALNMNLTDTFSISQSIGMTSKSKNLKNPFGTDQVGSSLDISTAMEYVPMPTLILDAAVNQSAPVQGDGAGAVKVYDDNLFRLYHVAQTSYELTATMLF